MNRERGRGRARSRQAPTLIWLIGTTLALAACATPRHSDRIAFTDTLVSDFRLNDAAKRQLQYYTSDEIRLTRASGNGRMGISRGRLVTDSRERLQQIVIPAGTPGIAVGAGQNWLAVSFSSGTCLYFITQPHATTSRADGGSYDRYFLYPPDWVRAGSSAYDCHSDYYADEASLQSYLLVGREAFTSQRREKRVLPGRKLYD